MKNKILASFLMLTLTAVFATVALCIGIMYRGVVRQVEKDLEQDALYISQGIRQNDKFLKALGDTMTRVTVISEDGRVLFDNSLDAETMQNHAHRPEIELAKTYGQGRAHRKSDTLDQDVYYFALRLQNGNFLRVARNADSVGNTVISMLPYLLIVIIVVMAAAYLLAQRLSKHLVAPLAKIDLDAPLEGEAYDELGPFLRRIDLQNKELKQAMDMRREFTANVSHELKTPLQSISGYAELISTGLAKTADIPRFIDKIRQETAHLIEMVDNIMKISRLDEGTANMVRESVDLRELITRMEQRLEQAAATKRVRLQLHLPAEPCQLTCIPTVLEEVVHNLIENAIKYNKTGGTVDVYLKQLPGKLQLKVADTGIGIASEDKTRVFERFYRSEKSHSTVIPGNGLGLSIVKHGVQLHQGTIDVASALGEGTTFTVTLKRS